MRFRVETLPKIFVGGVNPELAVNRQEYGAHEDQSQGQSEIILDESDPILVSLAGKRKVSDRAGLRRHYREANGQPAGVVIPLEIGVEIIRVASAPRAVRRNAD